MFKIGLNQDFQQIKQDQYVYSKGEVYKPTGAVRPAWWNVRRWKLSSEFGLGWESKPTLFSSRSVDMRTKSKQLLAKNLQQTQVFQMSS